MTRNAMQARPTMLATLALLVLGTAAAAAQDAFPSRTIRMIVPTSPGATTDVLARVIAQALNQSWGRPVVVENRPGADELLGAEAVAKSPADGYTLLVTSNGAITSSPQLHSARRYDPLADLAPIVYLGQVTPVMVVAASTPVKTFQELVAYVKSQPGKLNYGSFGNGSYSHVAMEDLKQRTGMDIMHIPYRGAVPAYTALLRDETVAMIANLASATGHAQTGKARIIAAAGPQRSKFRPDLPTIAESGVPGFSTGAWWGLFGPANLPPAVFERIRSETARLLTTPDVQKVFVTNTMELVDMTPDQFRQFLKEDVAHWGRLFKAAGIKPN
ncbi:MAG: tripartite tricarboxylate transporter substrate binding protein [Hyphomicrobiales bacterium]|nr:tripartite tricarboxylate transporter substrate binding protein [Hyphomicrobiales bacterium]